jgi:hypothetical protein
MADKACSARLGQNPGARLHRRIVPHVLRMTALQVGNPVSFLVLVEADDPSLDCGLRPCVGMQSRYRSMTL